MQPPAVGMLAIALIGTVLLAVGAWYVFLRGSGPGSEFEAAYEKVVAAEERAKAAMAEVTRFIELEEFNATLEHQMDVLRRQQAVFERIAADNDDERAQLASEAADSTAFIVAAAFEYRTAVVNRKLTTASRELQEMDQGKIELDQIITEWKNLE